LYKTEEFSTEAIGSSSDKTLGLETAFSSDEGNAQEIQDELTWRGQIMGGVLHPQAHLTLAKDDIRALVQTVLGAPVLAERPSHSLRVGWQVTDIETLLNGSLSLERPLVRDHPQMISVRASGPVRAGSRVDRKHGNAKLPVGHALMPAPKY